MFAKVQDMPAVKYGNSPEYSAYEAWVREWGTEMDVTARQEQFNLFDRVNGREWG